MDMMDVTSELMWPCVFFTLLAIIVATVIIGKNKTAPLKCISQTPATHQPDIQLNANTSEPKDETEQQLVKACSTGHEKDVFSSSAHKTRWREDSPEYGLRTALKDYVQSPDAEEKPLRYMAGMLRARQLEKMMTREELEEEQRVQQEQLTAIFQLLRDKQDAFGDVTETDLEEQLKLYSI